MKINIIVLFLLMSGVQLFGLNSRNAAIPSTTKSTSIGIVIYSNDAETVWNALRLANYSKNKGDTVKIFLLGKGVELDSMVKTNNDLKEQSDKFLNNGGSILGCGTCLRSRNNREPQVCKFSSLADLYEIIRKNKIVLTF